MTPDQGVRVVEAPREPLTRGGQLVGYVDALRAHGDLERVLPHLPPATRRLVEDPPIASQWLPLRHNVALFVAVDEALGEGAARALAYDAVRDSIGVHLRPVVELTLTAFGTSPATLFRHAGVLLRFQTRGQELSYKPWSETAGELEIRVVSLQPAQPFFEAWAGIAAYAFDCCRARGAVTVARVGRSGSDGVGLLHVAWG